MIIGKTSTIKCSQHIHHDILFLTVADMKYTGCVCVQSCILQRVFIYVSSFSFLSVCVEGALLQSQLFLLELFRAQHDGILVHSGL